MKDNFVYAGRIKTRYLEEGQGAPVLLIHGGGAGADSWGNWKDCIPALAKKFRVLAVDMIGFGKTDKPDPATFIYSQEARVKHVIDFIEAMKLGKVSLVGNSMGGATALGVCMSKPELVDKLVLMGSAGLNTNITESIRTVMSYTYPSRENMLKLIQALTHEGFNVDPNLVEYRYNLTQQPGAMEAYNAMMKWIAEQGGLFYPEQAIKQVKHKVLIVNGKEDKVVPPELAWRFSQLLENSWLYLIPHCGHWAMIERPQEFCDIVSWFLQNA
jgi:2-hydroxy-6-oxo-6-(2'-aminophenyl)hexa-2,4-dienoate hydrolase